MVNAFNAGLLADLTMAHELTHALDDQYYQLDAMTAKELDLNTDAEFAVRAVIEGSGTSMMGIYMQAGIAQGWLTVGPEDFIEMQEMVGDSAEGLNGIPTFLIMNLALPYIEGNKFLVQDSNVMTASLKTPEEKALKRAFTDPPVSSEQVLHFEKYWDPKQIDLPVDVPLPDLSAKLGPEWEMVDEDTLGELACYVLTEEELPDMATVEGQSASRWTNDAATGWGGDKLQLYKGPEGAFLAVWATVWDTAGDAEEFAYGYQVLNGENPFLRSFDEGEKAVVMTFANAAGEAKAKELRRFVEKLITTARQGTLHARRQVIQALGDRRIADDEGEIQDQTIVQKLFDEVAPRYVDRPGGYTRIIRLSDRRIGDAGKQVLLQLIEEAPAKGGDEPTAASRRKKRAQKRHAAAGEAAPQADEAPEVDEPVETEDEAPEVDEQPAEAEAPEADAAEAAPEEAETPADEPDDEPKE